MKDAQPSATARSVAMRRAMHQLREQPPIFDDPLALRIVGAEAAAWLRAAGAEPDTLGARALRIFLAVRSRVAEDELAAAVARGTRQYVVLGAGLDTFAYRNPYPGLRVFEVDHPSTQEFKRHCLEAAGIAVPDSLTLVPVDFTRETFIEALERAGLDLTRPTFFSWLGVTPYLAPAVTLETLGRIGSLGDGTAVVFDYARPRASAGLLTRWAFDAMARRVARAGEPFIGFFESAELARALRNMGFTRIDDLDADALNARCCRDRTDGVRVVGTIGRVMVAARGGDGVSA